MDIGPLSKPLATTYLSSTLIGNNSLTPSALDLTWVRLCVELSILAAKLNKRGDDSAVEAATQYCRSMQLAIKKRIT